MIESVDTRLTQLESELSRVEAQLREETARRAQAEDSLRAHQDRFVALGTAGIATFDWHPGVPSVWSPQLEALYGLPAGGYDGKYETWLERVHPDDRTKVTEHIAIALQTG